MRGCCALASSASLLLALTLSTVIGLSEGWKPDSCTSGGVNIWQLASATARPASARKRASGLRLKVSVPVDSTASLQLSAHDLDPRVRASENRIFRWQSCTNQKTYSVLRIRMDAAL